MYVLSGSFLLQILTRITTVDRPWKGKITTNWDNGSSPRTFRLHPADITPDPTSFKGTFDGDGSSYNGRAFDIKHGKYSLKNNGSTHISFDMKFISGEPTERFSGTMNAAETRITGTIKLKHPEQYDGPQTSGAYAGYHCSVTLH